MSYPAAVYSAAVFGVLFVTSQVALGQDTPLVVRVEQADAVVPQAFTLVRGVRELPDGRVIVTD